MNRRLYGSDLIGVARGRSASRARSSAHVVFAAHARWAAGEHAHARMAERHAWAAVFGHTIDPRNLGAQPEQRPVGEVHYLPIAR